MRWIFSLVVALAPLVSQADPPVVEPPGTIEARVGIPFALKLPKADKKLGQDGEIDWSKFSRIEVLPESNVYLVTPLPGSEGEHKVRYWTIGDKITKTVQLDDKPPAEDTVPVQVATTLRIKVLGETPRPPPKQPDPKDPPTQPQPTGLYFMLVRSDGAADPSFTRIVRDPAWSKLKDAGHKVKDFGVSDLNRLGVVLPSGSPLPCVVTLYDDGRTSRIVRGPIALPSDSQAILDLPKGVSP